MRTLTLLALILAFLYTDQNLLAPNLTAIASDFGFDEASRDVRLGGVLSLAATAAGAVLAIIVGPLADRMSRVRLLAAIALSAEVACLATGFARTWGELLALRMLTAAGLGGALPVAFSLLGDVAPERRRAFWAGILWTATGAGIILGILVAGQVGPVFGWRLPFVLVAVPGIVLVSWFALAVPDPSRWRSPPSDRNSLGARFREVLAAPVNRLLFLEAVFEVTPFAVTAAFLPDFLAQERGFSIQQASVLLALFGAMAIISKSAGGWLGDLLYERRPANVAWLAAIALGTAVVPGLAILRVDGPELGGSLAPAFLLITVLGLLAPLPKPLVTSLLIHSNPANVRGTTFAAHRFATLAGRGLAPLVVAGLSLRIGRASAMALSVFSWIVAALLLLIAARVHPKMAKASRREASG